MSIEDPKALAQEILHGLWVSVVGFDPRWRVVLWNPRAQELFGLTARQAVGRSLAETRILGDTGPVSRLMARVEHAGELVIPGVARPTGNGSRPIVHRLRRVDGPGGEPRGYLCLSGPLGLENSSQDRELGELFGLTPQWALAPATSAVVEEMRRPLQVILLSGELLREEIAPEDLETGLGTRVQAIVRSVDDLSRLLQRLDDLARSAKPRLALRRTGREPLARRSPRDPRPRVATGRGPEHAKRTEA